MGIDVELMGAGDMAEAVGPRLWEFQALFDRGLLEEPRGLGRLRVFRREDLPLVREAAVLAGYSPEKRGPRVASAM